MSGRRKNLGSGSTDLQINPDIDPKNMSEIKLEKANEAYESRKAKGERVSIPAIEKEFQLPAGKLRNWRSNHQRGAGSLAQPAAVAEAAPETAEVQEWQLDAISMHGNIRTKFEVEELQSLANSLRSVSLLQFPLGYVEEKDGKPHLFLTVGERRLRAHELRRARGEDVSSMKVRVIPKPSPKDFLTMNFVENFQRVQLTPSEEADGIQQMLELEDEETGVAPFNVNTVADELGVRPQHVVDAMNSLRAPAKARKALDDGLVCLEVVSQIGSLPEQVREDATEKIIFGIGGAMRRKEARSYVANNYRRDLRKAEFDREDETLTEAPACTGCEWFGGNRDDLHGPSAAYQCLNPACFMEKQEAAANLEREKILQEGGDVVLMPEEQLAKVFDEGTGRLAPNSGFVSLDTKPEPYFLSDGKRGRDSAPTWRKACGDDLPTVHVAWDKSGKRVDLVEIGPAMKAALGNPYATLFRAEAAKGLLTQEEEALQRKIKSAVDKAKRTTCVEGAAALFRGLSMHSGGFDRFMLRQLVELAVEQGLKPDDCAFLCEMIEPSLSRSQMTERGLLDLIDHKISDGDELLALLTLILQVRSLRYNGFDPWCEDSPMAHLCREVDFKPADWRKKQRARAGAAERKAQREAEQEKEVAAAKAAQEGGAA